MRTGRALIRLGHEAILSPMLDIVLDAKAPIPERSYQAVLVTSSNAVRALAARAVRPVAADIAASCGRRPDGARGKARRLCRRALGGRSARRSRRARGARAFAGGGAASLRCRRGAERRPCRASSRRGALRSRPRCSIAPSRGRRSPTSPGMRSRRARSTACSSIRAEVRRLSRWRFAQTSSRRLAQRSRASVSPRRWLRRSAGGDGEGACRRKAQPDCAFFACRGGSGIAPGGRGRLALLLGGTVRAIYRKFGPVF